MARQVHCAHCDGAFFFSAGSVVAELDGEGRAKLVAAQRAWIAFRDAEAEYRADSLRGGSAEAMTRWGTMASLTRERTKTLTDSLENDTDERRRTGCQFEKVCES